MKQYMWSSIFVLLGGACTSAHLPVPAPTPSPQPAIEPTDTGSWTFAYRSDTLRYQIARSAAIESQSDSGTHREITTNNTDEILSLSVVSDTVRYAATIDTFSTTTQGLIGTVQQAVVPVQTSGVLNPTNSQPDSSDVGQSCDPVQSSLQSDIRNLLISLPAQLATGSTWQDSTTRRACYGTVPVSAVVVRRFSVVGRVSYSGLSTVAIQRIDSISAHGEGRQLQHRVVVDATGTGSATYYLIPEQSAVFHLTTSQDLDFVVQASGRSNLFRESAKQEYSLVR